MVRFGGSYMCVCFSRVFWGDWGPNCIIPVGGGSGVGQGVRTGFMKNIESNLLSIL